MAQQPQTSHADDVEVPAQQSGTVTPLPAKRNPPRPIPGLRPGWYFRPTDRMILHSAGKSAPPLPLGQVPEVLGRITYRMSDQRHTRIAYQIGTETGARIITADEVLDGTWADKAGRDRPVTSEERHAYARILSEDVRQAPEIPALPIKDKDGGITLPNVDAQELGYLRTSDPDQTAAWHAWRRILTLASQSPRTLLALAAVFAAPLISSLHGVPAHILNVYGTGQIGKSTWQKVMIAELGDPSDNGELFGSMNNTGFYLPETLIEARYLPMCREETSSSTLALPELEKVFQRIVSGAKRGRLGKGGKRQQSAGGWHSIFVTSSNESLLRQGQVESLASRLLQLEGPGFRNAADNAEAWDLAARFHGWPLIWARDAGHLTGHQVQEWRRLHTEIVERLTTQAAREAGGIPLTLARIVAAWCLGGYMLGELLGMAELGARAEEDARAVLPRFLGDVTETHLSPGQILWEALSGAIAQEPAAWVSGHHLASGEWPEGIRPRKVLGYHYLDCLYVYVSTLKDVCKSAGIDTPVPGLKELKDRRVLKTTESAKYSSKHPSTGLRNAVPGRVYVIDTGAAQVAFTDREKVPDLTPPGETPPADDSATVASEERAMGTLKRTPAQSAPVHTAQADAVTSQRQNVTTGVSACPAPVASPAAYPAPAPATIYPAPLEDITDKDFASLLGRASGRTLRALRVAVLGADSEGRLRLHLPNHTPVSVGADLSVSVLATADLMRTYSVRTLWLHASALPVLGLPDHDERQEAGTAQRTAAGYRRIDAIPGPMSTVEHSWTDLAEDPAVRLSQPGLTSWMSLGITGKGGRPDTLNISIPEYDSRFDKAGQAGRGGWGGAQSPESLLDALMVYLLSTEHGLRNAPKVTPYYMSPNLTGEDAAGGKHRADVACDAIREQRVPPAAAGVQLAPLMVPQQWHREPTAGEREAGWLHRYDKSCAWLAAYGSTKLGIGEPVHGGEGTLYNKAMAGYWRVADVPGAGPEGLPRLFFREVDEGGYWLPTPSVELLRELYPHWTPLVRESWHWERSSAALSGMYRRLTDSRNHILAAAEDGRPGAKWAKQVNSRIYQSFRGYLSRQEPKVDPRTGEIRADDVYYRPDWGHMLIAAATANQYRNLRKYAAEGHFPLSVYVDAVTYVSDHADPEAARPASMRLGVKGGTWSHEGAARMSDLLPVLDDPAHKGGPHKALDTILKEA